MEVPTPKLYLFIYSINYFVLSLIWHPKLKDNILWIFESYFDSFFILINFRLGFCCALDLQELLYKLLSLNILKRFSSGFCMPSIKVLLSENGYFSVLMSKETKLNSIHPTSDPVAGVPMEAPFSRKALIGYRMEMEDLK